MTKFYKIFYLIINAGIIVLGLDVIYRMLVSYNNPVPYGAAWCFLVCVRSGAELIYWFRQPLSSKGDPS